MDYHTILTAPEAPVANGATRNHNCDGVSKHTHALLVFSKSAHHMRMCVHERGKFERKYPLDLKLLISCFRKQRKKNLMVFMIIDSLKALLRKQKIIKKKKK